MIVTSGTGTVLSVLLLVGMTSSCLREGDPDNGLPLTVLGLSAAPSPCPRHRLTLHLKQNYSEMKPGRTASGFTAVCQTPHRALGLTNQWHSE